MLGFVNSKEEKRQLGGEIYRETRRNRLIITGIFGIIAFALFNLVLYYLTRI